MEGAETAVPNDGRMEWIKEHPFQYDDSKSLQENTDRAQTLIGEYEKLFGFTYEVNTPERIRFRENAIRRLYEDAQKKLRSKNVEPRQEKRVFFVLGMPAAGKSTEANAIAQANGAIIIDSDDAKELIPEYAGGLLADAVHDESKLIAGQTEALAAKNGDNILLPLVGGDYKKIKKRVHEYAQNGYEVNVVCVSLPYE